MPLVFLWSPEARKDNLPLRCALCHQQLTFSVKSVPSENSSCLDHGPSTQCDASAQIIQCPFCLPLKTRALETDTTNVFVHCSSPSSTLISASLNVHSQNDGAGFPQESSLSNSTHEAEQTPFCASSKHSSSNALRERAFLPLAVYCTEECRQLHWRRVHRVECAKSMPNYSRFLDLCAEADSFESYAAGHCVALIFSAALDQRQQLDPKGESEAPLPRRLRAETSGNSSLICTATDRTLAVPVCDRNLFPAANEAIGTPQSITQQPTLGEQQVSGNELCTQEPTLGEQQVSGNELPLQRIKSSSRLSALPSAARALLDFQSRSVLHKAAAEIQQGLITERFLQDVLLPFWNSSASLLRAALLPLASELAEVTATYILCHESFYYIFVLLKITIERKVAAQRVVVTL